MKFTPAKDYDGLLKQALALHATLESQIRQSEMWRRMWEDCDKRLTFLSPDELQAERQINEKLTDYIERLEGVIEASKINTQANI